MHTNQSNFYDGGYFMGNNMDLNYEMFCYQCEQTANGNLLSD